MINFAWPRNPATLDDLFAEGTPPLQKPLPVRRSSGPKSGMADTGGTMEEATEYALGQSGHAAQSVVKDQSRLPSGLPVPLPVVQRPTMPAPQRQAVTLLSGLQQIQPVTQVPTRQKAPHSVPKSRTLSEYKQMLARATEARDSDAIAYFQSKIDKGLKSQSPVQSQKGSILSPFGQGLTFGFSDEIAGAGAGLANLFQGGDFSSAYDETTKDYRDSAKAYSKRHPYISTAAKIGSGLVLPLGAVRSGVSGLRTALKAGAAYGAGTAEGDLADRATGAATGAAAGALGHGALKGLGKLGRAVVGRASPKSRGPEFRKKVDLLDREGFKVTSPERIADPTTRFSQEALRRTYGADKDILARPQKLHTKLMERSGFMKRDIDAGELSMEAVQRAKNRFGKRYEKALENVTVPAQNLKPEFSKIEAVHNDLMPFEQGPARKVIESFRDEIDNLGTLTGREYKRLRSGLADKANRAARNPQYAGVAHIYRGLRDMLDNGFRAAAPVKQQKLLKKIDREYGGFKLLSDAANNPEAIDTLANRARANSHRIDKDFHDLVTAYQDVLLRGYPQSSGTAENLAAGNLFSGLTHGARAAMAPASAAYERVRRAAIPGTYQRAPKQRAINAAVQKAVGPVADGLRGGLPFSVGQQAPGSVFETLPASFFGGFDR